ncbi:MAG: M15 family metallopeptidase [Chitinophagaceae bacterium]
MPRVFKIRMSFTTLSVAILVFFLHNPCILIAQDTVEKRLEVIRIPEEYSRQVKDDPAKQMVELKTLIPTLIYDLRYATTNNFMHRLMYPLETSMTFLRRPAADSLLEIQEELNKKGIGIKIFDAYRPYSVTVKFWELVHDERYVANPARGSGHNRGIAVDLTLVYLKDNSELDMGTGFDNFSDTAHHSFTQLPRQILQNRKLLRSTMEKYGFKALETEWWHYFLPEGSRFEVLDIEFEKL